MAEERFLYHSKGKDHILGMPVVPAGNGYMSCGSLMFSCIALLYASRQPFLSQDWCGSEEFRLQTDLFINKYVMCVQLLFMQFYAIL